MQKNKTSISLALHRKRFLYPLIATATILGIAGCGGTSAIQSADTKASSGAQVTEPERKPEAINTGEAFRPWNSTVVDDTQAAKSGPSQYWHQQTGLGINNEMIWTYVNGSSVSNYMVWHSGLGAGKYDFQVYVPRNYATTRNAKYQIESFQGSAYTIIATVAVNQYNYSDVWVDLGTYSVSGEPAVFLADNTGEAYSTKRMVGFDAVMFTPQSTTISVPCFCQTDSRWGGKKLLPSIYTMANSGCLVTAIASVVNWGGFSTDPGKFCDWLCSNGGFDKAGDYMEPPKTLLANYTNNKVQETGTANWHSVSADLGKIKSEIDAGRPVVIEVHYKQSDSEAYMHWVTVVAYTLTGSAVTDLTIMDPLATNDQLTTIDKHYNYTNNLARWIYAGRFFSHS